MVVARPIFPTLATLRSFATTDTILKSSFVARATSPLALPCLSLSASMPPATSSSWCSGASSWYPMNFTWR